MVTVWYVEIQIPGNLVDKHRIKCLTTDAVCGLVDALLKCGDQQIQCLQITTSVEMEYQKC